MQLTIESSGVIGTGSYPDFIEFEQTEGELFYLQGGVMYGTSSEKLSGAYDAPIWLDNQNISPENEQPIQTLELKSLSGFGIVGSYTTPEAQKLIIYEFQHDMSKYLNRGSIKYSIDNPVASFSLSLENPEDKEAENPGNIVFSEYESLLRPGAKIIFSFAAGTSEDYYPMGAYYIDRASYDVSDSIASVDGRNLIGKALIDQTLNNSNETGVKAVTQILTDLLENANLTRDQFEIAQDFTNIGFAWKSNKTVYSAIEEIMQAMINWKIEETAEGEILIGSPDYNLFPGRSTYTFLRNKDIFSRTITMDDEGSYRRVCVHDKDYNINIYRDVVVYTGWNLQNNKTLFVEVAEGTSAANAEAIAVEIANRIESVGRIETFNGPFRPHLLVGDQAVIIDDTGQKALGLITEITHNFGKSGFTTQFTVDSGGRLGRGRLADYIKLLDNSRKDSGSVFYDDLPPVE